MNAKTSDYAVLEAACLRLAEAERLLSDARRNLNVNTLQGKACQREIEEFMRDRATAKILRLE